MLQIDRNTSI